MTREEYIKYTAPVAQKACKGTPFFPSVMIAQAIVEGNNGNSLLASKYHNHFGIKTSRDWKGKVISLKTKEVYSGNTVTIIDGFRAYDSLEEGFKDRNNFLLQNTRYKNAGVLSAKSPEQQAEALQTAGYATDPQYAQKLIQVINGSGKLKRFDN